MLQQREGIRTSGIQNHVCSQVHRWQQLMADSCAAEGAKALHLFFKPCGDLASAG